MHVNSSTSCIYATEIHQTDEGSTRKLKGRAVAEELAQFRKGIETSKTEESIAGACLSSAWVRNKFEAWLK